jgi:CBS domain-containing protein
MVGGAAGLLLGGSIPVGTPGLWALLVMAGVMGCAMRAPLTAALFGFEVTGNAHALVALLLVCMVAHLVGVLFQERSIMTEKLALRGHDVRQELTQDPFEIRRAGDFVRARAGGTREPPDPDREKSVAPEAAVDERTLLSEVIEMMERREIRKISVVARNGDGLLGEIDRDDLIAFYAKMRIAERKRSRILGRKR